MYHGISIYLYIYIDKDIWYIHICILLLMVNTKARAFYIFLPSFPFVRYSSLRFNNHPKSLNLKQYENDTELSKKHCHLTPKVTWKLIRICAPFNKFKIKCYLCLHEKLEIASYKGNNLLNKRSKHINTCRHHNKFILLRHDSKD